MAVSVVIPTRNEGEHIAACLSAALIAVSRAGGGEVLVVDGRSEDQTPAVVDAVARAAPEVRRLDNPRRSTPAAFNIGLRAARHDYVAIVSGHSTIPPDYLGTACRLLDEGRAEMVGGPIRTVPGRPGAMAWVLAQVVSHPFGVGKGTFRTARSARYVDAVPFPVFRRDLIARVGLFDEALVRNQDTEYFGRCARASVRILLEPTMEAEYRARGTLGGLFRQGFGNAYWNVLVWRTNRHAFRLRHIIPGLFATSALLALGLGFAIPAAWMAVAAAVGLHLACGLVVAFQVALRTRRLASLALPLLFLSYHLIYGLGSIGGLRHFFRKTGVLPAQ